ncbi:uncharacterized protein LOC133135227 isoform X1 [Conger conger]|uniref:uncharacterized protein LOC133135227 isoform X1 n=1 Tax=Conger conger TaxID=82655 RepID=UPI002A59F8C7|nr:uncharacterized protein LOC133135227 isoform X1 [Conger conger]XP_061108061.1 uncharacterized protein LOC133135227 isoform X1 [Conger conger]XP_061108062.1 uncharacterized protein LOC133135227 isoform X1 [Conger conger]XP_061108064.1 uncharacterized protein LOC133135227 isoform X1 [Conger conger]
MFPTGCTEQHYSNWSNRPVGARHIPPQQYPSSPGSNRFPSSRYNGGLCNPPPFHMPCPPRWPSGPDGRQSSMEQFHTDPFFRPGCTYFFPHEGNNNIFIPPGYNSSPTPFPMVTIQTWQHYWDHFSTDQYDLAPSSLLADLESYATEDWLCNDIIETDTHFLPQYDPELAPPFSQVMPTTSEEQCNIIVENMHVDNMTIADLVPGKDPEKTRNTLVSSKESIHKNNGELIIWETEIPQHQAAAFLGKEGQYLKFVKQRCGGLVYMSKHPRTQDYVVCNIMGTKNQVYKALDLIKKRVKCQDLKNIYSPPTVTFGGCLNKTRPHKRSTWT